MKNPTERLLAVADIIEHNPKVYNQGHYAKDETNALENGGVLVMDEHWERSEIETLVTLAMDPDSSLTRLADVAQEITS